jgi:hypothetical protein
VCTEQCFEKTSKYHQKKLHIRVHGWFEHVHQSTGSQNQTLSATQQYDHDKDAKSLKDFNSMLEYDDEDVIQGNVLNET